MNKTMLVTSLFVKGCLLGNSVMAAEDAGEQRELLASLSKDSLPGVERSLLQYAQNGDNNAQLALAKIYESENSHNPNLMLEWYKKSAISGNAEAQFQLGLLYIDGEVPDGDWDTGLYWVEMAAAQGHERAKIVYESLENEYYSIGC